MSNKTGYPAFLRGLLAASMFSFTATATAGPELSAGVWWVYQNTLESDFGSPAFSDDLDAETGGNFADPAFILYATDDDSHDPWHFQAEMRIGTGSFTSPTNNNSGDNFTMHKAWIGYDLNENNSLKVGKSQVPFGWKTINFWPGDLLQAGYGDQMDVGFKLSGSEGAFSYDLAYYHQDDWGETSTDTVDDNGHWGGSATFDPGTPADPTDDFSGSTYRKIKTGVVNLDYNFTEGQTIGVSYQNGRMQDLSPGTTNQTSNDTGTHEALDVHYYLDIGDFVGKYRYIDVERDFDDMDNFVTVCSNNASFGCPAATVVENSRHAAHLGLNVGNNWYYYLEGSTAKTDTRGNNSERVEAYAPGIRYDYGPGWLYLEYLWSNGDIAPTGDVYEADFRTIYASFDFYF